MVAVVVVLCAILLWVVVSRRLSRMSVTAPILLMVLGLLFGAGGDPLLEVDLNAEPLKLLVEVTLALVLFCDASGVGLGFFRTSWQQPARLLGIGLPLTVALGWALGMPLLAGLSWAVVAVIASTLAPTDAALGASVISDERIPGRTRETINVESGVNDGLATPIVLFFIAVAVAEEEGQSLGHPIVAALVELAIALVVGALVGGGGGRLLRAALDRGLAQRTQVPLGVFCLVLLSYFGAVLVGGNGFVAAFVAGLAFGHALAHHPAEEFAVEFSHELGELLGLVVWFLFGLLLLPTALSQATWRAVLYALLSLTVIRMVPVALSLVGTRAPWDRVLLIGWLGPRGLASIVFAIIALEDLAAADGASVAVVVGVTVGMSVLLHGLSAGPLAGWYARRHPTVGDAGSDATGHGPQAHG